MWSCELAPESDSDWNSMARSDLLSVIQCMALWVKGIVAISTRHEQTGLALIAACCVVPALGHAPFGPDDCFQSLLSEPIKWVGTVYCTNIHPPLHYPHPEFCSLPDE